MTDLTTLPNALAWLGMPADDADGTVARLISAISNQVHQFISYDFTSQSYDRFFNGKGTQTISLPDYPITAVSAVEIWGRPVPARVGTTPGFVFDRQRVKLDKPYSFERGLSNVRVMYTAGYATTPPDVEQAVLMWVKAIYDTMTLGANVSEVRAGDRTVKYNLSSPIGGGYIIPMPVQVWSILQPYQRVFPV